jgi:hypothetical protein
METIDNDNYIDIDFLIAYIHKKTGVSSAIIRKVLDSEETYMREFGLMVDIND